MMSDKKTALVVEGGGMRGIFAAGVLDEFLQDEFNPFRLLIGVSSGAITVASYLSGQYQRYLRLMTGTVGSSDFLNIGRFFRGGHLMDLDRLWEYAAIHDPLDAKVATGNPEHEFLVEVTDVLTGEPVFLKPDRETLSDHLLASSALPVVYRRFVEIEGRQLTDGGVAGPIPVKEAYDRGAREITVIRSRPSDAPKGHLLDSLMAILFLRGYPALRARILDLHHTYERAVRFIRTPPASTTITEIAPSKRLMSGRILRDVRTIEADYLMGRKAGRDFLSEVSRRQGCKAGSR